MFFSLNTWVGLPIFDSVLFLLKFTFLLRNSINSLTSKPQNSFENQYSRKVTHTIVPKHLFTDFQVAAKIFNIQLYLCELELTKN